MTSCTKQAGNHSREKEHYHTNHSHTHHNDLEDAVQQTIDAVHVLFATEHTANARDGTAGTTQHQHAEHQRLYTDTQHKHTIGTMCLQEQFVQSNEQRSNHH